jgi:hypothetical protein
MTTQVQNQAINALSDNLQNDLQNDQKTTKRPYQKPDFISKKAFERQALACTGCLNQSASFPSFCSNRS